MIKTCYFVLIAAQLLILLYLMCEQKKNLKVVPFVSFHEEWNMHRNPNRLDVGTTRKTVRTRYVADLEIPIQLENRTLCPQDDLSVLFLVHTACRHRGKRDFIRTLLNVTAVPGYNNYTVRVLFLLGRLRSERVRLRVQKEFYKHGDILQGDFLDSYRNLTYKFFMGLGWANKYCKHAKYVVKMDDDVYVDLFNFFKLVYPVYDGVQRLLLCLDVQPNAAEIMRTGRWSLDNNTLRHYLYFPWRYCSGFSVILSGDMLPLMYKAIMNVPFLWVDDIFVFGKVQGFLGTKIISARPQNIIEILIENVTSCFTNRTHCKYVLGYSSYLSRESIRNVWKARQRHLMIVGKGLEGNRHT